MLFNHSFFEMLNFDIQMTDRFVEEIVMNMRLLKAKFHLILT